MNCVTLFCYWGGTTCDGSDGVTYDKPPNKAIKVYRGIQFDELVARIYGAMSIDKQQQRIKVMCRYPSGKAIKYVLLPVNDNDDVDIMFDVLTLHQELSTLDLYLEVEDNEPIRDTEMASRNHVYVKQEEERSNELPLTNTSNAIPPLKDQLNKKKKTTPLPEKSDFVGKSRIDVNLKSEANAPKVNPKSSLTDSDWTELLSAPSKTVNGSNGGVPRVSGLLKDEKREVRSGSNLFDLERKRSQAAVDSSAWRSNVLGDKVIDDILDGNQLNDNSDSKHATVGVQGVAKKLKDARGVSVVDNATDGTNRELPAPDLNFEVKDVQNRSGLSGVPITSSSKKTESLSVSDVVYLETDSDSTSDSESEREREERRKRREQNLEKILDERAKQQAQEIMASSSSRRIRRRLHTPIPSHEHSPQADGGAAPKGGVAQEGIATQQIHPWLRFTRQHDMNNLIPLMKKDFESLRFIHWSSLHTLGLKKRAKELCGPVWTRFFSISQPVYRELTLEFVSTLHFEHSLTDYASDRAITFRLGGVQRRLSLREFATRMGLYTKAELDTPLFTDGITAFPQGVTPETFWPEIGSGVFTTPSPKSTHLRDPLHRIIHRAIAHTICARRGDPGSITQRDMFVLYCIIGGHTCNVAYLLARYLTTCTGARRKSPIYGGAYVTQLARSYHLLSDEVTDAMISFGPALPIDLTVLLHMGVIQKIDGGYLILDGQGRPWPPKHPPPDPQAGGPAREKHPHKEQQHQAEQPIRRLVHTGTQARLDTIERAMRLKYAYDLTYYAHIRDLLALITTSTGIQQIPRQPAPDLDLLAFIAGPEPRPQQQQHDDQPPPPPPGA